MADLVRLYGLVLWCSPLLALASYVVYQRYFSPLARVPGPFFASLTTVWLFYHDFAGQQGDVIVDYTPATVTS
jgi:hypothetical protein